MLHICIPTYNRARFLLESLESIVRQFSDTSIAEQVHIFILDNQSEDDTKQVVESFLDRYANITYVIDSEKRGLAGGIAKAASMAQSEYIWIFSDDDIQQPGSIARVLRIIAEEDPDLIICNVDSFIEKETVHQTDLLVIQSDRLLENRREVFAFLNTKFPKTIDYYTTYCSNWILKKTVYDEYKWALETYSSPLDLFPFPSIIFYTSAPCKTYLIAESIVKFRADNALWAKKNKFRQFFYWDRLWRHHYRLIVESNKPILPSGFGCRVCIKNILRYKELFLLTGVHISQKLGLYNLIKKIYKRIA